MTASLTYTCDAHIGRVAAIGVIQTTRSIVLYATAFRGPALVLAGALGATLTAIGVDNAREPNVLAPARARGAARMNGVAGTGIRTRGAEGQNHRCRQYRFGDAPTQKFPTRKSSISPLGDGCTLGGAQGDIRRDPLARSVRKRRPFPFGQPSIGGIGVVGLKELFFMELRDDGSNDLQRFVCTDRVVFRDAKGNVLRRPPPIAGTPHKKRCSIETVNRPILWVVENGFTVQLLHVEVIPSMRQTGWHGGSACVARRHPPFTPYGKAPLPRAPAAVPVARLGRFRFRQHPSRAGVPLTTH